MNQIKKNQDDPDAKDISPDIIRLAQSIGVMRQHLNLYLSGVNTWTSALELMVISMAKEFITQQNLLVHAMKEQGPQIALGMPVLENPKLLKGLPKVPLNLPHDPPTEPILSQVPC